MVPQVLRLKSRTRSLRFVCISSTLTHIDHPIESHMTRKKHLFVSNALICSQRAPARRHRLPSPFDVRTQTIVLHINMVSARAAPRVMASWRALCSMTRHIRARVRTFPTPAVHTQTRLRTAYASVWISLCVRTSVCLRAP